MARNYGDPIYYQADPVIARNRSRARTQALADELIKMGLSSWAQRDNAKAALTNEVSAKKDLAVFEKNLNPKPYEKLETSELQKIYDGLAQDLDTQEARQLANGDTAGLRKTAKGKKDIEYIGEILRKRAVDEIDKRIEDQANLEKTRAITREYNTRADLLEKNGTTKQTDPLAGMKVTQGTLQTLVTEKKELLDTISKYKTNYIAPPMELLIKLNTVDEQITALKGKLGVKSSPNVLAPKSPAKPSLEDVPSSDLLDLLNKPEQD